MFYGTKNVRERRGLFCASSFPSVRQVHNVACVGIETGKVLNDCVACARKKERNRVRVSEIFRSIDR